jgi:hypothetical protein
MPRGHSHRHIGDAEDLEHIDPDGKFIMVKNEIYQTGLLGKPKHLCNYTSITVEFAVETREYSHRYTAVYYLQKRYSTKYLSVYSYTNHFTILGKPEEKDLAFIPKFLYVYDPNARIWEDLD